MAVLNGFGELGVGSRECGRCGECGAGAQGVWGGGAGGEERRAEKSREKERRVAGKRGKNPVYLITMNTAIINEQVLTLQTC
ncbi:hypothetical protein BJP37_21675 [Moorena bouillonii PNG]|uniref:Uncharacterized protein n=1 Tax=Moorena bouillonii PNG TaxID=568701 RepID=A0A1U7N5K7_9CYAN|nr:hypothetical protein BJP37_21675 [Moorena bouillonii PNG]